MLAVLVLFKLCFLQGMMSITSMKSTHTPDRTALHIDAQLRSDIALRQILLLELAIMEINEACLVRQHDVECLHDYRVALRRSRIVLTRIPAVFAARDVQRFAAVLSRLGKLTGPCRDMDVLLQHWPDYALAAEAGFQRVYDFIQQQCNKSRHNIIEALTSPDYVQFRNRWREFLSQQPAVTRMQNAKLPVSVLASSTLDRVLHKLVKRLKSVRPSSSDRKLHTLRIISKRLRYLLDYFSFPTAASGYKNLIPELMKLQDSLGMAQDLYVQKSMIVSIEEQMLAAGLMQDDVYHALHVIKKTIKKRMIRQRKQVMKSVRQFLSSDVLAL